MRIQMPDDFGFGFPNDQIRVRATAFYEDLKAALRVKGLIECVQSSLGSSVRLDLKQWRIEWLRERSLLNLALNAARRSALLVICLNGATVLPPEMERWLVAWTREPDEHPIALVALLHKNARTSPSHRPLLRRLESAAEERRADFYCEFFEPLAETRPVREVKPFAPSMERNVPREREHAAGTLAAKRNHVLVHLQKESWGAEP